MGFPSRGCRCFYCQQQRPRVRRWALLLLALVALLSTGIVLACDEAPAAPHDWRGVALFAAFFPPLCWLLGRFLNFVARRAERDLTGTDS